MAPFSTAVHVRSISEGARQPFPTSEQTPDAKVYCGNFDPDWNVVSVPNGGYVLAVILEACLHHQAKTRHVHPIHITAHYLRANSNGPFKVHVRSVKTGKGFTNLTAELVQRGVVNVATHTIFGVNVSSPDDILVPLLPPSPYARRHPIHSHPTEAILRPMSEPWKFRSHVQWTQENDISIQNSPDSPSRTSSTTIGGGGLKWGTWFQFLDENERITPSSLAFLVDVFEKTPYLLPETEQPKLKSSWYPTMTMSIEFKAPIPPPSSLHAQRTVGIYSEGMFIHNPQGRHDAHVEIWTAPSNIGEGPIDPNWRENQVCLAVATHMSLTVPMHVNERMGKTKL